MTIPHTAGRAATADIAVERIGHPWHRLSWGSVFAGLAVATAVQLVLTLLGGAIGLAAWDPDESGRGLGIGAAVWALLSLLVALFLGGAVTGRLAGVLTRRDGFLHGLLLWAVSMLLTVWLIANGVGALAGSAFRVVGNVVGATAGAVATGAASAAGAASDQIDLGDLRGELAELLRQTGDPSLSPDSLSAAAQQAQQQVTQSGASNEAVADEIGALIRDRARNVSREDVINIVVARTGRSRAEAERVADRVIALRDQAGARIDSLRAQAGDVAERTAGATSSGLWLALLGTGLSLGAAVFGTLRTARE